MNNFDVTFCKYINYFKPKFIDLPQLVVPLSKL